MIINYIKMKTYKHRRKLKKNILSLYHWSDKYVYFLGLKKITPNEMPNFIIAGLPKCGTVWLVDALKEYKSFNYVENPFYEHKHEIRFFSFNFDKPIKEYFNVFRKQDQSLLSFEKSPDYSVMRKNRIKLIKKLNPSIKIILIFRDPVERAFSNAKMDLIRKREVKLSNENDYLFFKNYDSQLRRYDYKKILDKWYDVFSKDQILILSLEDIKSHPERVLTNVFSFLECAEKVNTINSNLNKAKNITKAKSIPDSHKEYIEKRIPDIIDYWNNNQDIFRLKKS